MLANAVVRVTAQRPNSREHLRSRRRQARSKAPELPGLNRPLLAIIRRFACTAPALPRHEHPPLSDALRHARSRTRPQVVRRARAASRCRFSTSSGLRSARGEQVVLRGRSGCGKTTLLNCIAGLTTVDSGTIEVNGRDVTRLPEAVRDRFRADHIGFVFQTFNLLPAFTALENVMLGMAFTGGRADAGRARQLLRIGWLGAPADAQAAGPFGGRAAARGRRPVRWRIARCCCWPTSRRRMSIRRTSSR